jgi:hypothetical protein
MPILIAGGDSFTWGSELGDDRFDHLEHTPSKRTWAALLAQHFNIDYKCVAKAGGANNTISRRVIKEINNHKNEDIYVSVMWTFTHRNEVRLRNMHPYNTVVHDPVVAARYDIDDYWINFNAWHGLTFDEKMEFFPRNMSDWDRNFFKEQHEKMTEIGITDASNYFYKVTGDYHYHNFNALKDMCLLQYYCENRDIPYFFCSASDELFKRQPIEVLESGLYDSIKWDKWYRDAAFHVWAKDYSQCGNHPGIEAHADWFNLILPKVSECFQK